MEDGSGTGSYAANSTLQNYTFHAFGKSHLAHAIDHCLLPTPSSTLRQPFRIADFGCAYGRNTLDCANFVVQRVREKFRCTGTIHPEIQYFFSDLPSNDFNSLFQILQPVAIPDDENQEKGRGLRDFYAAGVPGSFHGRLFPTESLNFAVSVYSLHWLSQVPPAVLNKSGPCWNGGHVWIDGKRPAVAEAYAQQFQSDVKNFLRCRAQEMRHGAVMFLFSLSRVEEHPKGEYFQPYRGLNSFIEPTWNEMVFEGLAAAEERDAFNLPIYNFCCAELELALKAVPELELLKIETMKETPAFPSDMMQQLLNNPRMFGEFIARFGKSLMKLMVEKHIGMERAAVFFKKMQRIATDNASLTKSITYDVLFAIMRKCK